MIRWLPLAVIVIVTGLALYAIQGLGWTVFQPGRDLVFLWAATNLALYIWIRAWSRLNRRVQVCAIVGMSLVQVGMFASFRRDGYYGDGRLIFKWRWTPVAGDRSQLARLPNVSTNSTDRAVLPPAVDFPSFRGPDRTGELQRTLLNWDWEGNPPRELWRRPVGQSWSSFVVAGDSCVTQEQRGDDECVVCYDLRSGSELWRHSDHVRFKEVTSGVGPRATPTIHGGRVYTLGAAGLLNCLDLATGARIWANPLALEASPVLFGFASSPLIHDRHVLVTLGGSLGSLVAVDRDSGIVQWRNGDRSAGYSSPQFLPSPDGDQILVFDGAGLHGHAADSGATLWEFAWGDQSAEQVNVCQPVVLSQPIRSQLLGPDAVVRELLLISAGYGRGSAMLALHQDAEKRWSVEERWLSKSLKSKFSCIVTRECYAYGFDEGILTCISLRDGSRQWKRGRYGYGQLLLVDTMLLIQAESGRIHIVEASPEQNSREIATLAALSDRTWNHPALAGQYLLVRNDREAACYLLPSHSAGGPSKPGGVNAQSQQEPH